MPIPWSDTVSVPASLSMVTDTERSPSSPLNSPNDDSVFSFCVASTAFETSSRKNISLVGIEEFFDYRKDVFSGNTYFSLHGLIILHSK